MSYENRLQQIDALQQQIDAHGTLSDELRKKIDYKFRLDWNYYSNSMEGNTLTIDETRSVMVGNLTVGGKPIKDVLEMRGHDEVVTEILRVGRGEVRLSEKCIKEIHRAIMHEDDPKEKVKIGIWKPEQNYLYNYKNERFDFVAPVDVPDRMHDLLNRTNAAIDAIMAGQKNAPNAVDVALRFQIDYVTIHPFYDGNGRTARILTNLLLISLGYPPFWVRTDEREAYHRYLADIQGYGGEPELFLSYMADLVMRSQRIMLDAIEGKEINEVGDVMKRLSLLKKQLVGSQSVSEPVERSLETGQLVYKNVLDALLRSVVQRLNHFDSLFKNKRVEVAIDGVKAINVAKWIKGGTSLVKPDMEFSKITLTYVLKDFRKSTVVPFSTSIMLEIRMHRIVYEGVIGDGKEVFSKLYNEELDEEEKLLVFEAMGAQLLAQIEGQMKGNVFPS